MIHVSNTGTYRIEGLERAHQCAGWKHVNLDASAGRQLDGARQTSRARLKSRYVFRPIRHHLELPDSLRERARVFSCRHGFDDLPIAGIEALPYGLVDSESLPGCRLMEARIIVIGGHSLQTHRHIEPWPNPLARFNGPGLQRRHDLAAW